VFFRNVGNGENMKVINGSVEKKQNLFDVIKLNRREDKQAE